MANLDSWHPSSVHPTKVYAGWPLGREATTLNANDTHTRLLVQTVTDQYEAATAIIQMPPNPSKRRGTPHEMSQGFFVWRTFFVTHGEDEANFSLRKRRWEALVADPSQVA